MPVKVAILKETAEGERRVAATPDSARQLVGLGCRVVVESGAGDEAGAVDDAYRDAGAEVAATADEAILDAQVVLKVQPPSLEEADRLPRGSTLVAFLKPSQSSDLLAKLAERGVTALSLESVPRITRAQSMDALSATANLVGYRAVIEAAGEFGRFFNGQMTAAGMLPPAKVLVIGAGVAGLAAVGAAKGLGAIVRAFDTRAAAREQVESLGGEFLTVEVEESGEGAGGYAREMSQTFIEAEYALFREQAKDVDVVITTAQIPGKSAPRLWLKDMVEAMRPGSVVVDLAAEQGGNCEYTERGRIVKQHGVTIVGRTDLPSRMANTASALLANVMVNLLKHLGAGQGTAAGKGTAEPSGDPEPEPSASLTIDLDDEITSAMAVAAQGEVRWPPPKPPAPPTPPAAAKRPPTSDAETATAEAEPARIRRQFDTVLAAVGLIVLAVWMYLRFTFDQSVEATGDEARSFVQHLTVFIMACFVGWHVIWTVTPALHTPLMAVTNAISGIILVGGILTGGAVPNGLTLSGALGLAAIVLAMINVAGGFLVTHRMLAMFRKD